VKEYKGLLQLISSPNRFGGADYCRCILSLCLFTKSYWHV